MPFFRWKGGFRRQFSPHQAEDNPENGHDQGKRFVFEINTQTKIGSSLFVPDCLFPEDDAVFGLPVRSPPGYQVSDHDARKVRKASRQGL